MIPLVFAFPQDPMPGFAGAFSGITHGKCFQVTCTPRGVELTFYVGSLDPVDPNFPDATQLDRFRLHRAVDVQTRLAPWDDLAVLAGPTDALLNVSLSHALKAAWNLYRIEEGLPPDPPTT